MMPTTSISFRWKAAAAVEITALAAGAGPPAKRIATRLRLVAFFDGAESGPDMMARLPAGGKWQPLMGNCMGGNRESGVGSRDSAVASATQYSRFPAPLSEQFFIRLAANQLACRG